MQIETIKVGELRTNCYIVKDNGEAIVIDPGSETEKIIQHLKGFKVKSIILTHGHYDHVTEAFILKQMTGSLVMINKNDEPMMSFSNQGKADWYLNDGDKIQVGKTEFIVILTPGHSQGGICLYCKEHNVLISGDTLFHGTYGRTDLPGSSQTMMGDSLKKLFLLPENTKVYPGHGQTTTIKDEKSMII